MLDLNQSTKAAMTFADAYVYSDVVISRRFEGIDTVYKFNETEILEIRLTQVLGLTEPLSEESRKRWISLLMYDILQDI